MSESLLCPRRVHSSEVVRITDTLCASGAHSAWGDAEAVDAAQVILIRRGAFAVRGPRGRALGDPASALLLNAAEPYEVRHPVDGGDHCTALGFDESVIEEALSAEGSAQDADRPGGGPFAQPQRRVSVQAMLAHARLLRALQPRPRTSDGRLCADARHDVTRHDDTCRDHTRRDPTGRGDTRHDDTRREHPPHGDTLRVDELALTLLGTLVRADEARLVRQLARRARTEQRWIDAIDAVRAYLAANPACKDSLPQLARRVHTTPYHLARIFRGRTGQSIHEYRTHVRITAALQQLNTPTPITSIGLGLGFATHSHFTTRFTQLTGMSPSEYRNCELVNRDP